MTKQEKILYTLTVLFFITLFPSWLRIANIIVISAIVISCFAFFPFQEKLILLRRRKSIQGMILFFLLVLLSLGLSENIGQGIDYMVLRLPLILLPASIGLIYLRRSLKEEVLLSYAIVTTIYCAICLSSALYAYLTTQRNDALYNDNLTLIIRQQSVYIAFLVNIAVYVYLHTILFRSSDHKIMMALAVLFLSGISYLLGSRINLATLIVLSCGMVFYYILQKRLVLEGLTLVFAILIGSFIIIKFQPQMLNRYKELAYSQYNFESKGKESHYNMELTEDQWNGVNVRLAAWNCGWELFTENPIFGVGLGDKNDQLYEKYRQKNFQFGVESKKNVHNNYLDILYSMGIIGFSAFIISWVALPIVSAFKNGDTLSSMILLTLVLAWITEIYFNRSLGGIVSGFFVPFLLTDHKKEHESSRSLL